MTLAALAITFLPSLVLGWLLVRTFAPAYRSRWAAELLNIFLGLGVGAGVLSVLFFLGLVSFGASNLAYSITESLAIALAAVGCGFFRDRSSSGVEFRPLTGWLWLLPVAAAGGLILAFALFLNSSATSPYGSWDAWSIWNLRADLLAQPDARWRQAFSPALNQLVGGGATHGDYPLLLSGYIARCWRLAGRAGDTTVPIAVAGLFSLATVGLLVAGLAVLRGWTAAFLGGLVLIGTAAFLQNSAWQRSDVPLGFFYLAVFVLFFAFDAGPGSGRGSGRIAVLLGLALGLAAWTKDEGILFTPLAIAAFVAYLFLAKVESRGRALALFSAGASVPLATAFCFKAFLAPRGASWGPLTVSVALHNAAQFSRYFQILKALGEQVVRLGTGIANPVVCLAALAICLGVPRERIRQPVALVSFATLAALFLGYCAIYVITPYDLDWQLSTSAGRLLIQLLPSAIFLGIAACRTLEETGVAADEPQKEARPSAKKSRPAPSRQAR